MLFKMLTARQALYSTHVLSHLTLRTTQCSSCYHHSYFTYLGLWLERLGNLPKLLSKWKENFNTFLWGYRTCPQAYCWLGAKFTFEEAESLPQWMLCGPVGDGFLFLVSFLVKAILLPLPPFLRKIWNILYKPVLNMSIFLEQTRIYHFPLLL